MFSHDQELVLIHWIHYLRQPLIDTFFKFLNLFDTREFLFVLIPIIWINYGWKAGVRLSGVLLLSGLTNRALKTFFASPRPYHIDAVVAVIRVPGFGFPSGAAQTVTLLSGLLLYYGKSAWKWLIAFYYILFISFSRIYLGVHFFTDILGGWIVGFSLFFTYIWLQPAIERKLEKIRPIILFGLSQFLPLLWLAFQYSMPAARVCGVAMGMGIGIFLMHVSRFVFRSPKNHLEFVFRALIAVGGVFACYYATYLIPHEDSIFYGLLQFLLIGLWVSLISPLICQRRIC